MLTTVNWEVEICKFRSNLALIERSEPAETMRDWLLGGDSCGTDAANSQKFTEGSAAFAAPVPKALDMF